MKVKKLLMNKLSQATLALGLSLFTFNSISAQTDLTIDANAEWVGSMNCFDLSNNYLWSDAWGFDDLKAEKNTTNNSITLYPNFTWIIGEENYWVLDGQGQKIMQALPHIVNNDLIGENITFSGNVTEYTLAAGYTVKAYINMATVLDAEPWYIPRGEVTFPITSTGNFTLTWNTANAEGVGEANHLEYGFIVTGVNANPANMEALGNVVITDDEPQVIEPGSTTVTLDATDQANIIGYANYFNVADETYFGGSEYGLADLRTDINAGNNTLILYPNFDKYGTADFTNGEMGNKIFEGNTYKQDDALIGEDVSFKGHCISNSLAEGYDAIAFIKLFDGGYQLVNYIHVPLVEGEDFTVNVNVADFPTTAHVQYGYSVTGLNANPTQMEALGNAVVSSPTAGIQSFSKKAVTLYPNPAQSAINLTSQDIISSVSVYNMMGQQVLSATPGKNAATINVSGLNSGMYIISATVNGVESTTRFIKQ
ncbi:T9SS type A sorting domain-containing protein [Flavobacterium rhizosphaerae]|uniref:T9SS type A sorting domain-containing protein n=1 Tax=Flavobacterium rhizosphaerae TaxID=3163298 RepID=A0ABW8YXD1_9FLAO